MDIPQAAVVETETPYDLETIFAAHYERIARAIGKVIRDPARAEELAVEVFLKWSGTANTHGPGAEAWLYRTAIRAGLDELRKQRRRERYEPLLRLFRPVATPEQIRSRAEEGERVRAVLAALPKRQAELLLLRSEDLSYESLASTLGLNPASIGTFLSRAQDAFRKEFVKRYGSES